ncbi:SurA N-terminal domain-containing protein [Falsirhodobacter halotolerans]|uniref:SurA N-terminal domain-containing protein n=1 Tax=Falsirhodobacter halotolerans TaxID=1146892 RepID=UPI001FD464BC|nr:SurA N-terminal domain-containing protein [Falsirhodobacter halotolerans]MCJ8139828.1 SurA N-terminal domain-containing protein [Falsirhodobacter halotolerans]
MTKSMKRGNKAMNAIVWALMAMLILSLGGFGVSNFGTTTATVAEVGDEKIDSQTYANALQQNLQSISQQTGQAFTLAQARQFGLDAQVRQQLFTSAALLNEADRIGISAGDAAVANELRQSQAFFGANGQFDRNTYELVLRQNGLTASDYEQDLRDGIARSLVMGAVGGGFVAPAAATDTLYAYVAERRAVSALRVTQDMLETPPAAPTEDDLRAYYDAHTDAFQSPETRTVTYAALLPDDLAPTLPVDDAALQALYDQRIDEFQQPERRLVERLVFPDRATAEAARTRIDEGAAFEDIVAERGLALEDTDLGDMAEADLGVAGAPIFALTEPGVVGPIDTNLGPALFRMNGILSAHDVPLAEVRDDLAREYQIDAARRAIADTRATLDDALASGDTVADIGAANQMTTGTVTLPSDDPIAGYPAFRDAAAAAQTGDFPELIDLDDGGLVILQLDAITPPATIPFEDARAAVAAALQAETLQTALSARAEEIATAVTGGAALTDFGPVTETPAVAREGVVDGAPPAAVQTAFAQGEGQAQAVTTPDWVGVVRTDGITAADTQGDAAAALRAQIAAQIEGAIAQDAQQLYTQSIANEAGIQINQAAIDAVHAQIP